MKIVSFPHYTCGGLLCDILNNTFSKIGSHGGINSIHHNLGKIGDSDTVFLKYDIEKFLKKLLEFPVDKWIGTHCWLGDVDLSKIQKVINVTTVTYRSRLYRWIRAYHHYYLISIPWQGLDGITKIDKQRETAKNYLDAFPSINHPCVINLEFSDVVESKPSLYKAIGLGHQKHLERWREINSFLYDTDLWNSDAAQRFHEAEYEENLKEHYIYG